MSIDGKKPNILVADDDIAIRKLLRLILQREHYQVYEAEDGARALEIVENEVIEIILVDILMPNMTGIEFLRKMKSNPLTAAIPVILCTSISEQKYVKEALNLGISGYVLKPIVARDLLLKLNRAEKQVHPVLEDPHKTIRLLGLQMNEFRELVGLLVDEARNQLKLIGPSIEKGDLNPLFKFTRDLSNTAGNFGARALQHTAYEAGKCMLAKEGGQREKYLLTLRTQMERLRQAVDKV